MCPCRARYELFFFRFFVFSPKMWGILRPKYPQKCTNPKYLTKKNKKTKKNMLGRGTLNTCKILGSNSQKRRGHWHLKEFWVLRLNQPVADSQQDYSTTQICTDRYHATVLVARRQSVTWFAQRHVRDIKRMATINSSSCPWSMQ